MSSEKQFEMAPQSSSATTFTATGRPMPAPENYPFPNMARSSMGGMTAPQTLPFKFTDDTLIRVVVRLGPSYKSSSPPSKSSKSSKMLKILPRAKKSKQEKEFKTIRLPRSEYLRHFARDEDGNYAGTEEERSWSEEELDAAYGKYWEFENTKWTMRYDEEAGRKIMVAEGQ